MTLAGLIGIILAGSILLFGIPYMAYVDASGGSSYHNSSYWKSVLGVWAIYLIAALIIGLFILADGVKL